MTVREVHVGGELEFAGLMKTLLRRQLEPVAAVLLRTRPVVEILARRHALDHWWGGIGTAVGANPDQLG